MAQQQKRRQADGRSGISPGRLGHNLPRRELRKLPQNRRPQIIVCDNPTALCRRERQKSRQRLLDHGLFAVEREQLLGSPLSAQRPKPRAPAAGQDHGIEMWMWLHGHSKPIISRGKTLTTESPSSQRIPDFPVHTSVSAVVNGFECAWPARAPGFQARTPSEIRPPIADAL
jgi:hypothetical protein